MKRLFFFLMFLIFLEMAARLTYCPQSRLFKILTLLEQDSVFFWRHKCRLKTFFEGSNVKTNSQGFRAGREYPLRKKKDIVRIVCLGDSSTFGWGVTFESAYPQQLSAFLAKQYPHVRFEVINAGIIGYSSYQGWLLFKNKILEYSPDIITVAYMVNDMDRYRFFRSNGKPDKTLLPVNPGLIYLKNMLGKIKLYGFIQEKISQIYLKDRYPSVLNDNVIPTQARVDAQDYRHNLEKIAEIARENGIRVIFIKRPLNLTLNPKISEKNNSQISHDTAAALGYIKQNKFQKASAVLDEIILKNAYSSEPYFYRGYCYEKMKQYGMAEESFNMARKLEASRCGAEAEKYNKILEETAVKYGAVLVDAVPAFKKYGRVKLFLDPIHPSPLGHRIIAEEIYRAMSKSNLFERFF